MHGQPGSPSSSATRAALAGYRHRCGDDGGREPAGSQRGLSRTSRKSRLSLRGRVSSGWWRYADLSKYCWVTRLQMRPRSLVLCLGLLMVAATAGAEVMDKEPSGAFVIAWCTVLSLVGFLAGRFAPLLTTLFFPVATVLPVAVLHEIYDAYVGPAILHEAGWSYIVQAHVAMALVLFAPAAGFLLRRGRLADSANTETGSCVT